MSSYSSHDGDSFAIQKSCDWLNGRRDIDAKLNKLTQWFVASEFCVKFTKGRPSPVVKSIFLSNWINASQDMPV